MMKRLIMSPALSLALAVLPVVVTAGPARAAEAGTVDVTFEVGERKGAVMVALFDSESAYQKNTPVKAARVPVGTGMVKATFSGLRPGRYAAKAFHDVNDDGALNVNAFDMPIEPYGFSNNAPPRFGPPDWSQAAFDVATGVAAQSITLRRSER